MMETSVLIAGAGGQGVQLIGQLLAAAAVDAGLDATCLPSYSGDVTGGFTTSLVVIASEPIDDPFRRRFRALIALDERSLVQHEPGIEPGGWSIVNSSLVKRVPSRSDVCFVPVPASERAARLGLPRSANLVVLGRYAAVTGAVPARSLLASIDRRFAPNETLCRSFRLALESGLSLLEEVDRQ